MSDRISRMVDILLEEGMSGEPVCVPDEIILAKARRRKIRTYMIRAAAAAAVLLAIIPVYQYVAGLKYQEPDISLPIPGEEFSVSEGTEQIRINRYVTVSVLSGSRVRIPEQTSDALFLEQGTVRCSVKPEGRGFRVLSEAGEAEVTGTVFSATVLYEPGAETDISLVKMDVSVEKGTVVVRDSEQEKTVRAGGHIQIDARVRTRSRQRGRQRIRGGRSLRSSPEKDRAEARAAGPEKGAEAGSKQPGRINGELQKKKSSGTEDLDRVADMDAFLRSLEIYIGTQAEAEGIGSAQMYREIISGFETDDSSGTAGQVRARIAEYAAAHRIAADAVAEKAVTRFRAHIEADKDRKDTRNIRRGSRGTRSGNTRTRHTRKRRSKK